MAVECFDVWNTFPGGKIVAEEEYRGNERQIGVRDADGRRDRGKGAAERLRTCGGNEWMIVVELFSSSFLVQVI